jgi:SWI/SNF-related matrix-associated actin-dependent regulator 1 of chromatin subfamily A
MNRPSELWTICQSLDRDGLGKNWRKFHEYFCNAYQNRWGWDTSGASNLVELAQQLRSTFMIRRLKQDVMAHLPSKTRQIIALPPNGNGNLIDTEWIAYRNEKEVKEELKLAVQKARTDDSYQSRVDELKIKFRVAFTETAKARKAVAVAKVPHVIEHVRNALEQGPVVLFAHHLDVVQQLVEAFDDVPHGVIIGKTSLPRRQEIVTEFQAGKLQLIVAGLQAASEGITLTKSCHVIFAEMDWNPAKLSQAEDRCHRHGQTKPVLVQHLVMDESLDATMAATLTQKQVNNDLVLNAAKAA